MKYSQTAKDLMAARAMLQPKNKWSDRTFYKDGKVCAAAALEVAMFNRGEKLAYFSDLVNYKSYQYLYQAALQLFRTDPMVVNDLLGYEAVIKMYNRACHQARRKCKVDLVKAEKNRTLYSFVQQANK
jgi:hypothetical protein